MLIFGSIKGIAVSARAGMSKRNPRKVRISRPIAWAVLGVALLAAQTIVLNHVLDSDSHTPDAVCEFCVTAASLEGANVADVSSFVLPSTSPKPPDTLADLYSPTLLRHHLARAPPTAS